MKLKLITASLATFLALTISAKDYHYKSVAGDPMQTRIYTLDNGLKVYLSVNKEKPRLQTYIAVRTGSRNDPAETTGLAHYLEHLMFKGTKLYGTSDALAEAPLLDEIEQRYEDYRRLKDPTARKKAYHEIDSVSQIAAKYNIPNEYDKIMRSIGAEGTNAYTSNDVTCYVNDIPANEIESWAKVESDRFRNMVIRGFHTELEAVYEEFNIGLANDSRKMWEAMFKKLFPTHPYGTQSTIGTQEHLKNPSITNIKNYFKRYYVPNNIAICMAGDFDPDKVMAIIDKYFGDWQRSSTLSRPEYAPVADLVAPTDTTVIGQEAEHLMIGWKTPNAASYDTDTLRVIADILSNGKAGLFDVDLNQPMRVQSASAFSERLHDYGMFILYVVPTQGQSLEEAKGLVLAEMEKLKKGQFDEKLLRAVVNNLKLDYYKSLQSNSDRADKFVNAFINECKWEDEVRALDRISNMTKRQIVDYANRHLRDNYVVAYKKKGVDNSVKKIDKPAITPIPTNNDMQSDFLKDIVNAKVAPIEPRFVDFSKDLSKRDVDAKTVLLYKKNDSDGLFNLEFDIPVGRENDSRLHMASALLDYAGTAKMSANDIKKAFYDLACNFNVSVRPNHTRLSLSGLNENMPAALKLFTNLLEHATISKADYDKVVGLVLKSIQDSKQSQRGTYMALISYGVYGKTSPYLNSMTEEQMKASDGNELLLALRNARHLNPMTIMYYGPTDEKTLLSLVKKDYPRRNVKATQPLNTVRYTAQPTPKNEVLLAHYDAKNIYMVQYNNANRVWNMDNAPLVSMFNEYFSGGMNAIVFQELREARGLAYSASARYNAPYRLGDKEYFNTFIITQSDKMMDCIGEFNNLLNHIPQNQAGFELAKQSLLKSLATNRHTRFNTLNYYMTMRELGLNYDIDQKIYDKIPSITLDDIVNFAKERIANKPYKYLIVGDEKNLDTKSLEKIAPIRRVSEKEIFGF